MRVAVDEAGLDDAHRDELWHYMQTTAEHMVNSPI
jgi:hemoglobin